ncbi:hypothetical protein HanIR_Chr11g0539731 [Helianthus annuus]|nr:hypothetical protein HanIR_Chr11g0539731 [Helianthus annuus]
MTANEDFCNEKGPNANDGCCDSKGDSPKSGSTKPPTLSCCVNSVLYIAIVIFLSITFIFVISDDPSPTFTL